MWGLRRLAWMTGVVLWVCSVDAAAQPERELLRAGVLRDWPPYYELDDDGEPAGFAVDSLEAVAAKAGFAVEYQLFDDFPAMIEALGEETIDIIPSMGILESRRASFDFSQPLETFDVALFVRYDTSGVASLADLTGRPVGVVDSNVGEIIARERADLRAVRYADLRTAIYELLAGRIDGLIYPRPIVEILVHRAKLANEIHAVGPSLGEVKRAMAVRAGDPVLGRLEPAIDEFLESDAYAATRARWLQPPPSFWTVGMVAALSGGSLLLLIAAFAWIRFGWRRRHQAALERSKHAERERRVSQGRVRGLLDQASDGVFLADETGQFTEVNRRGCEMTGYSREELLGLHLTELLAEGDLERQPLRLGELEVGKVVLTERLFRRKDGSTFPGEISATVLEDGRFQGILRDVSERHAAAEALREKDAQLQQAQKLEAIGRLAGGVAHDFNNLLTVMIGNGTVLERSLDGDERALLGEIMDAASRAAELTRQLLAYSRRQVIQREVFDVRGVLDDVRRMLERVIGEDVALLMESPAVPCLLEASKVHLEQILLNLAVNARDAMPEGGTLAIRCTLEGDSEESKQILLRVNDTGCGMDAETLDHIFEPFYTTKDVTAGTGLGLAMVHSLTEQMGGTVEVESAPGEGATFLLRLPVASGLAAIEEPSESAPQELSTAGVRVLVVEDEDGVRRLLVRVLKRAGFEVVAADCGAQALERLASGFEPELLITDVVMPEMSGVELAETVGECWPELPMLFISGYSDRSLDGVLTDSRDFLAKPFAPDQLLDRVRALLGVEQD